MKKKYSRIAEVRVRYGNCSTRTVDRGVQRGIIAPPEYLNGIRIWDDELLDEYDAERSQGSPPTPHSPGGRGRPKKGAKASPRPGRGATGGAQADGNEVDPIAYTEHRKAENAEQYPEERGAAS
jgi:hypothetical protein